MTGFVIFALTIIIAIPGALIMIGLVVFTFVNPYSFDMFWFDKSPLLPTDTTLSIIGYGIYGFKFLLISFPIVSLIVLIIGGLYTLYERVFPPRKSHEK